MIFILHLEPGKGSLIFDVIDEMMRISKLTNLRVETTFNGCRLVAKPDTLQKELIDSFHTYIGLGKCE